METKFAEQFRARIASRPHEPIRQLREAAFAEFTSLGFPGPKLEDWKYTSVAAIAAIDWTVDSDRPLSPATLNIDDLARFNYKRNGFAALNLAFADVAVLRIEKDTVIADPIELSFAAADGTAIFPHVIVLAGAGSRATIVESYAGADKSLTNTAVQVFVDNSADLTHYRVQRDSPGGFHIGITEVTVSSGSRYDSTSINLGAALSRHDIDVKFIAEGGEAFVDGLYMLSGKQHHDTHSIIDHQIPNCISHQTYKGVLNDNSRAVFNGKVFVREDAHGTDAQQSNKNLLLSNNARVDTKPQLEIFNDDVKCSHGATVGQLEEEELFYLLTRGLPNTLARNLLTYGFAEEIINKIKIEGIKSELDTAVLNRLNTSLDG
jgi:Fe-S cluster assembly protein SufD